MRHRLRMLLVIVALATSESLGLTFNLNNELVFLDYTWKDGTKRTYEDQFGEYQPDMSHGECGHWAMRALCHGCPELFDLLREWGRDNPQCNVRRATYNDGLPESARAVDLLKRIGFAVEEHTMQFGDPEPGYDDVQQWFSEPPSPGDVIRVEMPDKGKNHALVIFDDGNGQIHYRDHNGVNGADGNDFMSYLKGEWADLGNSGVKVQKIHPPTEVMGNRDKLAGFNMDSSWTVDYGQHVAGDGGRIRHAWICCWHENIGGTWPWEADSTGYACLSWEERSGHTWDSMISPRMNLAGCFNCVLLQSTYSTLDPGEGTRKMLISTDGANWQELCSGSGVVDSRIGIPMADDKRNVRIAWFYDGSVQVDRAWCVDDIEIWASPMRTRDVAVSGIAYPCGAITQGTPIVPRVYVVNHGKQVEEFYVGMTIDGLVFPNELVRLQPYADTLLEYGSCGLEPGPHTVTCYALLQPQEADECRANDTATLQFSVVQDTWIERAEVYDGGGMREGACLAAADSNRIFCSPGKGSKSRGYAFAKYLVDEDLWKSRRTNIWKFQLGSALAYPGTGDFIYAIQGSGTRFYRYCISDNRWDTLNTNTPKMGNGAGLACLGTDSVYLLRGASGIGGGTGFYVYNVAHPDWGWQPRAPTLQTIKKGGRLVCADGLLYALRGGRTRTFYRYHPVGNYWDTLPQTPVKVYGGAALAYDSLNHKIYAFFGNKCDSFFAYDINSNQWMKRKNAPRGVRNGGCLTYNDHSVYGGVGIGGNHKFWRYSPLYPNGLSEASDEWLEPAGVTGASSSESLQAAGPIMDPGEDMTFDPTDKYTPQYSPDGLWIAYAAEDSTSDGVGLYRIPVLGGNFIDTLVSDSFTCEDPRWSSGGNWLVVAADNGIYRVSSGSPPVSLAGGLVAEPQVTPDDSWVLYQEWDPNVHTHHVHRVRPDGTRDSCLTPGTGEYLEPLPITNSEFACARLKGEVYQLSKSVGGQETWLTSDYMNNACMDVSPDRQWLTYEKRDESGYWQIYRMRVDGTNESRVSDGACDCETPVYSPNGQYIAYTRWPVDSTGSTEFSQVCYSDVSIPGGWVVLHAADAERHNPCWSPDCQFIIYEKLVESSSPSLGQKEKRRQIGRARTHLKPFDGVQGLDVTPRAFALYQNRPNPFGRATTIRYALPVPSLTELNIYDVAGRTVTRLVQSEQKPGYYSVAWKGTDMRGRSVAAGTYFYVLKSNGKIAQKRMLLVR